MKKSFAAPKTISRIAARRVYQRPSGKDVVLTIGVPRPVPGSDWGCAIRITGLNPSWRRPRYVFGIDALQALHLAMSAATTLLESSKVDLEWFGQKEYLCLPRFLPELPKAEQDRLAALVEREVTKFWSARRRSKARSATTARAKKTAHAKN